MRRRPTLALRDRGRAESDCLQPCVGFFVARPSSLSIAGSATWLTPRQRPGRCRWSVAFWSTRSSNASPIARCT
jgi:hypothetical protein